MHTIFFSLKRAHHGVLRVTRPMLAKMGLTPARFDLLYAVREREGLRQIALCRALGVSGATVSRMVRSLEKLGLLVRDTSCADLRQRFVYLTDQGRRCIRKAVRRVIRSGTAELIVDSALCPDAWGDREACLRARQTLDEPLRAMRLAYRDIANLYDPWCPADDDDPVDLDLDLGARAA
jgi:DNA-binding MarR family transcriptional regulator